jgi:transposase-like protein
VDRAAEGEEADRVDEAAERANGREVCAWAAMDVDARELPAIKASWSRSSMDTLLFLSRVLEACKNKPVFVVEGGPAVLVGPPGARAAVLPRDVRGRERG